MTINKMLIKQNKTQTIISKYASKHQFMTRGNLNWEIMKVVPAGKPLGTSIQNDF